MRTWKIPLVVLAVILLGGCSLLNEVNNSLEYADEAQDYINQASQFAHEIPELAERAVTGPEARQALENKLENMKQEIAEFKEVQAPEIAKDVHAKLSEYNTKLEEGIDTYLQHIEDGQYGLQFLEESGIISIINEISKSLELINQLGS